MRAIMLGFCGAVIAALSVVAVYAQSADEAAVIKADEARCQAISDNDMTALGALLTDDNIHIHTGGRIENKKEYLTALPGRPRKSWRDPAPQVQVYGDVALMYGPQFNQSEGGEASKIMVSQVWVRQNGVWKEALFHAGPHPES